jgi:hypothetical protein
MELTAGLAIEESTGFFQVQISGIFYHPGYGYVTLRKTEPSVLHDCVEWPNSGSLVVTGADSSKAK